MSGTPERLATALADRYRIERELGQGGMATVYLAEDLKHDRKVALKVLKPELAAVLGAERFVVEIKTTAALQHPHILPLFDSGTADGFLYYVMPYIEGETLRDKLTRETQFGVNEAVKIATEIADALHYAHQQGVIHRDIKPENILLANGRPMVADFGIALAVSAAAGGRMTETGLSLGTPHYMSPEQATADKEISARSDVYSLASVLYEMLAGVPPHEGGSAQQTIMRIIADTPRPVSELRKSVAPNVAAAVALALEKLPADRFASAKEFADALTNPAFAAQATAAHAASSNGRLRVAAWAVAASALVALAAGYVIGRNSGPTADVRPVMFHVDIPDSVTQVTRCCGKAFALSPDGHTLVFVGMKYATGALYRLSMDRLGAQLIPGTEEGASPFFSPDGEWVAFEAAGMLKKVRLAGGPVVPIAETGLISNGTWTDRDQIVYATTTAGNRLWMVSPSGGEPVRIAGVDSAGRSFPYPEALPGGRAVLSSVGGGGLDSRRIVVVDLETGRPDTIGFGTNASFANGYLFIGGPDGTLTVQPFDPEKRRLTGEPSAILSGIVRRGPWQLAFSVSAGGSLVYESGSALVNAGLPYASLRVADVARSTDLQQPGSPAQPFPMPDPQPVAAFEPAISPEGRRLIVRVPNVGGTTVSGAIGDLWMFDIPNNTLSRFTVGGAQRPVWTRDGLRVTYCFPGNANVPAGIYSRAADLSGSPELIVAGVGLCPSSWTPDGQLLLTGFSGPQTKFDIGIVAPGDSAPRWILRTAASELSPKVSPDGRWLAFTSGENVWVRPMSGGGAPVQISAGPGESPLWSVDGGTLYYVALPEKLIVAATLAAGPGALVTERTPISRQLSTMALNEGAVNWDIFPDGKRILFAAPTGTDARPELVVVRNWQALIREMSGKQ